MSPLCAKHCSVACERAACAPCRRKFVSMFVILHSFLVYGMHTREWPRLFCLEIARDALDVRYRFRSDRTYPPIRRCSEHPGRTRPLHPDQAPDGRSTGLFASHTSAGTMRCSHSRLIDERARWPTSSASQPLPQARSHESFRAGMYVWEGHVLIPSLRACLCNCCRLRIPAPAADTISNVGKGADSMRSSSRASVCDRPIALHTLSSTLATHISVGYVYGEPN